jgi:hypothetical protein
VTNYGNADTVGYLEGNTEQMTITVTPLAQTIDFADPADKIYGDAPFVITATSKDGSSNTGLEVVFTSQTTSICTVGTETLSSGVTSVSVTGIAKGTCTIEASQPGGTVGSQPYAAATPVVQSLEFAPRPITIKAADKSKVVNGTEPTPSYTITVGSLVGSDAIVASSVVYTFSSGSYTASTTIPNVAGSYTITPSAATMTGGRESNYTISYDTGVLTVSATATVQTIDFPDPADKVFGDDPFTINATSKDGSNNTDLEVVFTSQTPSVCTVGIETLSSGVTVVTVTILSAGTCTIEASQPGGSNGSTTYGAATPVTQSFVIAPKPLVITAQDKSKIVGGANPTFTFTAVGLVGSDAVGSVTYTFSSSSYTASTTVPDVAGSFAIAPSAAVFSAGLAGNYAISYVNGTLTVTAAPVTAANTPALGRVIGEVWFDINKNNVRESNEPLLPGLPVSLESSATVSAAGARGTVKRFASTLVTDPKGGFDFTSLQPGTYTIRGNLPDSTGITKSWDSDGNTDWTVTVVVVANQTKRGDLAGVGEAGFLGLVTNGTDGSPTPGAEVTASWAGFDKKVGTTDDVEFQTKANSKGVYTLAGVPIGKFEVEAVDPVTKAVSKQEVTLTAAAIKPENRPRIVFAVVPKDLPATGSDNGWALQIALVLLGVGAVTVATPRVRRRRQRG